MNRVVVRGVWADDASGLAGGSEATAFNARLIDGFAGQLGQTRVEDIAGEVVCLTGLGLRASASPRVLRQAARAGTRRVSEALSLGSPGRASPVIRVDAASFTGAAPDPVGRAAVLAGMAEGGYAFRMLDSVTHVSSSIAVEAPVDGEGAAWALDLAVAHAVSRARDLVNLPASALTPSGFADRATEWLLPLGVQVVRRDSAELKAEGFGGLTAIGKAAENPPVLLELSFGKGQTECTFVAKGVTYDSGGLSLKAASALMDMKSDMAGAAAVVAAFSVLPLLAPERSFRAVVALVENMPGPRSVRPGDVVVLRDGSTLEILNTDFEGRVILADALAVAAEGRPKSIVDLATLTYAATNALGDGYAALVASDDDLAGRLTAASARSGDRVWRMPLQPELDGQIRSDVADYKNFPGVAEARISSAALLLSQFVGDIPWAHVDMAGPAFQHFADAFSASGGTGFGVRLITEFVAATGAEGSPIR